MVVVPGGSYVGLVSEPGCSSACLTQCGWRDAEVLAKAGALQHALITHKSQAGSWYNRQGVSHCAQHTALETVRSRTCMLGWLCWYTEVVALTVKMALGSMFTSRAAHAWLNQGTLCMHQETPLLSSAGGGPCRCRRLGPRHVEPYPDHRLLVSGGRGMVKRSPQP